MHDYQRATKVFIFSKKNSVLIENSKVAWLAPSIASSAASLITPSISAASSVAFSGVSLATSAASKISTATTKHGQNF